MRGSGHALLLALEGFWLLLSSGWMHPMGRLGESGGDELVDRLVSTITYPSGRVLVASFSGGKLSALALRADANATPVGLLSQVQWEPFGPLRSWLWQLSSGTQAHERSHDLSGRLVRYRLGSLIRDVVYDAADRISSYTHYDAASGAARTRSAGARRRHQPVQLCRGESGQLHRSLRA